MSSTTTVVIFLCAAFIALTAVSFVNRRQTRARLIHQQLTQMKRRVNELEELSTSLEPLLESPKIPQAISEELVDLLRKMIKLSPASQYLEVNIAAARQRVQELSDPTRKVELFRVKDSDSAIARAQYFLNEAARVIRKRQGQGLLSESEAEMYVSSLSWAHLMVVTVTHVSQGFKALSNQDIHRAQAYFKNAQQALLQSPHTDERKHEFAREIGDVMEDRRKTISSHLIPEQIYGDIEQANV